ncbi:MAG: serine O-acetyltransferase EpsC [Rikenellaceae bacterium]
MTAKETSIIETTAKLIAETRDSHWESHHQSPSIEVLSETLRLISEVIFPEYLLECRGEVLSHKTVINLERIYSLMNDQICKAMTIKGEQHILSSTESITRTFIESLSDIKHLLTTDVEAIFKADPAARSYDEVVLCYPSITAMLHHRTAHSLHKLGVPIIPRVISEIAHSKTGIDIHPGATIASHFAIDHGTGVVIGETTIIGKGVVIYQGVTLGARGFRFDENGNALNVPRHPIIEDNVRIYSNSSILGCITIGHDSIIGGNMWIDKDVEPHSCIVRER